MQRDWNQAYKEGDTPWDKGAPAPPLIEFIGRHAIQGEVLVPGCGSGHDVRLLARHGALVTGLDLAPAAIERAEGSEPVDGASYRCGDFLSLAADLRGRFDWVLEHTCLCALEPGQRQAYADSVAAALKPGGQFLGIFYREVRDYTGDGPPHPITAAGLEALFGGRFELLRAYPPQQRYPSRPFGCEEVRWMRLR